MKIRVAYAENEQEKKQQHEAAVNRAKRWLFAYGFDGAKA